MRGSSSLCECHLRPIARRACSSYRRRQITTGRNETDLHDPASTHRYCGHTRGCGTSSASTRAAAEAARGVPCCDIVFVRFERNITPALKRCCNANILLSLSGQYCNASVSQTAHPRLSELSHRHLPGPSCSICIDNKSSPNLLPLFTRTTRQNMAAWGGSRPRMLCWYVNGSNTSLTHFKHPRLRSCKAANVLDSS